MAYKFNPFTSNFDIDNSTIVAASDPASAAEGTFLINTTSGTLKIYYAGAWHIIFTFPSVADELLLETGDIVLLETGDSVLLEAGASPGATDFLFEDDTTFLWEDSTTFLMES